jgi:hypothetical protein
MSRFSFHFHRRPATQPLTVPGRCLAIGIALGLGLTARLNAATTPSDLPALVPAYGELPPTFWQQHQSGIIIGIFAGLGFAFWLLKVLLRPESPVILPPETVARQSLAALQNHPEDGETLVAVAKILRRYISETWNLPEQGLTTTEFCADLAKRPAPDAELATAVTRLLREWDERKFSPAPTVAPLNAVTRASELIERLVQHEARRAGSGITTPTEGPRA